MDTVPDSGDSGLIGSTWHGFIAYFHYVEPYMPDWVLRQFGFRQCIPAHPIQPHEVRKPPNNRMYVSLKDTKSPANISCGFHVPVALAMPPQALLDLIACEATREDVDERERERLHTVVDLLRRHYHAP
ncbi:hypothetical protein M9H77_29590 [Catharanthus roseus]|uniref:Uncharacterized protein n=1 Tax=Catharanthus roseus TaxID=4058 RepID=A0ACB9ZZ34_CATRO|nr:hypothetical protein M9H77_29590 [Catharanthus roseus]